jgi:hypothetical protein
MIAMLWRAMAILLAADLVPDRDGDQQQPRAGGSSDLHLPMPQVTATPEVPGGL